MPNAPANQRHRCRRGGASSVALFDGLRRKRSRARLGRRWCRRWVVAARVTALSHLFREPPCPRSETSVPNGGGGGGGGGGGDWPGLSLTICASPRSLPSATPKYLLRLKGHRDGWPIRCHLNPLGWRRRDTRGAAWRLLCAWDWCGVLVCVNHQIPVCRRPSVIASAATAPNPTASKPPTSFVSLALQSFTARFWSSMIAMAPSIL